MRGAIPAKLYGWLPKKFFPEPFWVGDIATPCNILGAESTFLMESPMFRAPAVMASDRRAMVRPSMLSRSLLSNPR